MPLPSQLSFFSAVTNAQYLSQQHSEEPTAQGSRVAEWVKMLAVLSSIPGNPMMEGKNRLPQIVLYPHMHAVACICPHVQINKISKNPQYRSLCDLYTDRKYCTPIADKLLK